MRNIILILTFISTFPLYGQWYDVDHTNKYDFVEESIYIPYSKSKVIYQNKDRWVMMNADSASFRVVNKNRMPFGLDKDGVFIEDQLIKVDTAGFAVMTYPDSYRERKQPVIWKNNKSVYRNDTLLSQFDAPTFKLIPYSDDYMCDKNGLYYKYKKMEGVNPFEFHYHYDGGYFRDSTYIYEDGKVLHINGEPIMPVNNYLIRSKTKIYKTDKTLCRNLNAATFKPLSRNFGMDNRYVYNAWIPIAPVPKDGSKVRCYDWINCRYVVVGGRIFSGDYEMTAEYRKKGVDIRTFGVYPYRDHVLYDKKGAFYRKWNEEKRDVEIIRFPFKYDLPFKLEDIRVTQGHVLIYKDREFYDLTAGFMYGEMLTDLTEKQKEKLRRGALARNMDVTQEGVISSLFLIINNKLYYNRSGRAEVIGIDIETFEPVNEMYVKDKNGVYSLDYIDQNVMQATCMEEADKESFKLLYEGFSCDKNHVYFEKDIIENVSPKDIRLMGVFVGYRMGCSQDTRRSYNIYLYSNSDGYWMISPKSAKSLGAKFPYYILYGKEDPSIPCVELPKIKPIS